MRYVIAYDVTDDARRTRLAGLLLDHGDRVQKSVFEADLTSEELARLLAKAAPYLEANDSLRAYPMCAACAGRAEVCGRKAPLSPDGCLVV